MGRQGVRQDIQRLVKDVRHLVLEVLGSHCVVKHEVKNEALFITKLFRRQTERIQEILPVFGFERDDFSASTPDIRVDVERLP